MKRIIILLILLLFITSCSIFNTDEYKSWGRASDFYLYKNSHVIFMKYYKRLYWEGDNSYDELLGYVLYDFNYKTSELKHKIFELPDERMSKFVIYSQSDTIYLTGAIKVKYHIDNFSPEEFVYNETALDSSFYVMSTESENIYLLYQNNVLLYDLYSHAYTNCIIPNSTPDIIYPVENISYVVSSGGEYINIYDVNNNSLDTINIDCDYFDFDETYLWDYSSVKWEEDKHRIKILTNRNKYGLMITEYDPTNHTDTTYAYDKKYYKNSDGNFLDFNYGEISIYDSLGNLIETISYEEEL